MSVVTMRARLTEADIRVLMKAPNDADRGQAAFKICRCIDHATLSDQDREHAEAILRLLLEDAAELVRRALSVALKNSTKLPSDVAARLARDVDSVALPILEHSPVLSDTELVELLRSAGPSRQIAIASRDRLSTTVTRAIAEHGTPAAVERALANDNAEFAESSLQRVIQRLPDRPAVLEAMVKRRSLPLSVTEKLVTMVTGEVFDHLVNKHALPPQLAIDLASGARERVTVDLVEQAMRQRDLPKFIAQLNLYGRLTPSLVMRALCLGHIQFVEHAVAELAGLPHGRAWLLIHDGGPLGLRAAFDRAGLPPKLFPAFRAAIEIFHQLQGENLHGDRDRFRDIMLHRVLTLFQNIPQDDLDYLLDKMDSLESQRKLAM